MSDKREDIRNIAIIAHVDHGKTTLVDAMLRQTGEFKVKADQAQECVLDQNPQERERGITILSKCTSVPYKGVLINIVDTPGHADFGSEVERVLNMVESVLLLIDASDGPMPQTRFVLRKALELGLRPVVLINKVDRSSAEPIKALEQTFNLFIDLDATDHQLDFVTLYGSGKEGWTSLKQGEKREDLTSLFQTILDKVPPPVAPMGEPFQMRATMLDYDQYVGGIAMGRIHSGKVKKNDSVSLVKADGTKTVFRVSKLFGFFGLERREIEEAAAGDIIGLAGADNLRVGDTVSSAEDSRSLPPLQIDEPTISIGLVANDSPFSGREGKFLTSRHIGERLEKEKRTNVGLRVDEMDKQGFFKLSGRGELHLSVLIETMRREGFEMSVSRPQIIDKKENGVVLEPVEYLILEVDREFQGVTIEMMGERGAEMKNMGMHGEKTMRLEYVVSARALIGFKSEFMTKTKGVGLMHHSFHGYQPKKSDRPLRSSGVLVAKERGSTTAYALNSLQDRSVLFVGPGEEVYEGMIVGVNVRDNDMVVNPCKKKALTNMRAAGSDDTVLLTPPRILTLEQAIEFIDDDEFVEVTPVSIRMRKKILHEGSRRRVERGAKA